MRRILNLKMRYGISVGGGGAKKFAERSSVLLLLLLLLLLASAAQLTPRHPPGDGLTVGEGYTTEYKYGPSVFGLVRGTPTEPHRSSNMQCPMAAR